MTDGFKIPLPRDGKVRLALWAALSGIGSTLFLRGFFGMAFWLFADLCPTREDALGIAGLLMIVIGVPTLAAVLAILWKDVFNG